METYDLNDNFTIFWRSAMRECAPISPSLHILRQRKSRHLLNRFLFNSCYLGGFSFFMSN